MEEHYTIKEIAASFKVTEQAVYNWIKRGNLAAIHIGTAIRVTQSALDAFIAASNEKASKKEPPSTH